MTKRKIRVEVPIRRTARVIQCEGMFDIPAQERSSMEWDIDLDLDASPWSIGLIHGPSGSGKTTLAKELFGGEVVSKYDWPKDRALVDSFPESVAVREITEAFSSVGFSSPPAWLRPFYALSTGEQFRALLARALLETKPRIVLDEFTSVVDRTIAKVACHAMQRYIRRRNERRENGEDSTMRGPRQMIAVSCHSDIIDWLQPDWTLKMPELDFHRVRLRGRPPIELRIRRAEKREWEGFRRHHYLTGVLSPAAQCFIGEVEGRKAVFVASTIYPTRRGAIGRAHRTVCLPDFQGLGLGNRMSAFVASLWAAIGYRYFSTTSHPAMIRHRARSSLWTMTTRPGRRARSRSRSVSASLRDDISTDRPVASFRYTGPPAAWEDVRTLDMERLARPRAAQRARVARKIVIPDESAKP